MVVPVPTSQDFGCVAFVHNKFPDSCECQHLRHCHQSRFQELAFALKFLPRYSQVLSRKLYRLLRSYLPISVRKMAADLSVLRFTQSQTRNEDKSPFDVQVHQLYI